MELTWLELSGFRCYDTLRFEPASGVNVLVGDNGAGKTSVLEAIAYLGLLRSFRGTGDDYFVADRYRDGPFDQVAEESLLERQGGRIIHVAHGDLVNTEDRQDLAWRRVSRSAAVRGILGWLPARPAGEMDRQSLPVILLPFF